MSTNKAPRHGGESTLAVSGWTLRRKMALALAIPLILAAVLGGLQVNADLIEATNSSTSASQVKVLRPAVRYLVAAERATVAAQSTSAEAKDNLASAIGQVKTAAADLAAARDSSSLSGDQSYQVDVILDLSRALREDSGSLSPGTWIAQLRTLQSSVTQLITTIVNAQIDPEPRLELLAQALAGRFSLAMQEALVATDRVGDTGSLELYSEIGAEGVAIDRLASGLGDTEAAVPLLLTANSERFRTVRTKATDLDFTSYGEYDAIVQRLQSGIDKQLTTNANDARVRALVGAGGTLLALLATILLALVISRLILKPINKVREGALSAAREQLPDAVARLRAGEEPARLVPIDVQSKEEVGQLARAVDDLHRQAVLLASGEAQLRSQVGEMFVTLSRRNTALVNQQLALIEDLEKDEEDPLRLESLFKLDHLAARMRRTGDSLLILADAPNRTSDDGLTVADAMQAATAGVQEYRRVVLGTTSEVRISGSAAGDVVHLLTELVDNALRYSPPHANVTLTANTRPAGVTIEVSDGGLGISEEQLQELNLTLRDGADISPDTARRMGLFVVSRLAKRHGFIAVLQRNERRGTTASVLLPSSVLIQHAAPAAAAPELRVVPEPTVVESAVAESAAEHVDQIQARIDGALGLPVRRPGAALRSGDAPSATRSATESDNRPLLPRMGLPQRTPQTPDAEPKVVEPVAFEPASVAPESAPEPEAVEPVAPEPEAVEPERIEPPAAEVVVPQQAPQTTQPVHPSQIAYDEQPSKPVLAVVRTATTVAAAAGDSLDGAWVDTGQELDTPIFKAMRSAWLSAGGPTEPWADSEVEAGWERAEQVAAVESLRNGAGLPQRRPGSRLVPGGVTPPAHTATVARDPEAIRARLAAHAAGVSRGRRIAAGSTDEQTAGDDTREAGPA
jgi:signal transduction histidine kinase